MPQSQFPEFKERKFTILVVDDIPENIELISDILEMEGYEILQAYSGKQGINMAYLKMPDLILLDISMPEIDGFEVCTRLKEKTKTKKIPIIFLTAKIEQDDIIKGFEIGAVDYVTKPFNRTELLARISTHLKLLHQREIIESMNRWLEKRVDKRTEQLKKAVINLTKANRRHSRANRELAHLDKAKDDFLNIVSTELQNPLKGIMDTAQILDTMLENTQQRQFLDLIEDSARKLSKLSEIAVLITSLRAEKYEMEPQSFSLKSLIDQSIETLRQKHIASKTKQIDMINIAESSQVELQLDKNLLQKALLLVIEKAVSRSPAGQSIFIQSAEKENNVEIKVLDSGLPFSETLLKSDLELFATATLYERRDSSLELSTAKLIANTLGGKMHIANRAEGGGEISLSLPLIDEPGEEEIQALIP